eukprot:scaffold100723_cov29-Attheya_sp.AAC.4
MPSTDSPFPVIWDSGASISISNEKDDFDGPIQSPGIFNSLKGISSGLRIMGTKGHVLWEMHDTEGGLRVLRLPAFYVPKCKARLISTTSLLQTYPDESIHITSSRLLLSGSTSRETTTPIVAHVDPVNNLPTNTAYRPSATVFAVEALNSVINVVNDSNINLSGPSKCLLQWHHRLGHLNFAQIQFLMRSGALATSESTRRLQVAAASLQTYPKCGACQYGKQCRRPTPGKTSTAVKDRTGVLKQDHLVPGQQFSMDHFICSTKGRLFTSRGKTTDDSMYDGGCIFVDHATGLVHVEFQTHLTSHETLKAKDNFELMCRDNGVIVQSYLSDNGSAFTSKAFTARLAQFFQIIRFAGVGAHHHNGTAERSIRTIMSLARTMMLHAAIHWPNMADTSLWPMAVSHAVFLYNHVPNTVTGLSPSDLFTRTRWEQRKFHDLHVWGCPVYVLDKTLADGKKLPKWKPR